MIDFVVIMNYRVIKSLLCKNRTENDDNGGYGMEQQGNIFCNVCGRKIKMNQGILREDVLKVEKEWGYFSKKDTKRHTFHVCEDCYDTLVQTFTLPVTVTDENEIV